MPLKFNYVFGIDFDIDIPQKCLLQNQLKYKIQILSETP